MKINITRSAFLDALKAVQNVVAAKGTLEILQNVLMNAKDGKLTMTTTDLDISIVCVSDCEVIEAGETTLPVKLLFNSICKAPEGVVELDVDPSERATIVAGNARFRLAGIPAKDYPSLPAEGDSYCYKIAQATLKDMLRKVAYAVSQDDTRRTLRCVLMNFEADKLTMVATDGRRLAMVEKEMDIPAEAVRSIVLPVKTVAELQRSLNGDQEVEIRAQNTQLGINLGNVKIFSKLMDETYPNYRQVIPAETVEHVTIDRQLLLDALERASVMSMDEAHSIRLVFEQGTLTVSSAVSDRGEARDVVPIKYAGEAIEIIFNPSYVMDPLRAIDDDEITFNLNDGTSPAVITCSTPFLYVLMPLRIN